MIKLPDDQEIDMITWIENLIRNSKFLHIIYSVIPSPFRGLLLNIRAIPIVKLRYSKKTFSYLVRILERDEWTCDELMDFVESKLKDTFELAKVIPYYEDFTKGESSLKRFPVLEREVVRDNYANLVNPHSNSLIRVFTSGSSGSGMPVYYDKETYCHAWAYAFKHLSWTNIDPREWRITFFGSRVTPLERKEPPFWMKNHLEHQYMVSIFHISEENAEHYVRFLDKHQGLVLQGFPSVLYLIAQYVKALRGQLEFKAVFFHW